MKGLPRLWEEKTRKAVTNDFNLVEVYYFNMQQQHNALFDHFQLVRISFDIWARKLENWIVWNAHTLVHTAIEVPILTIILKKQQLSVLVLFSGNVDG